jgi:uncharacterized protein (DUF58 family)
MKAAAETTEQRSRILFTSALRGKILRTIKAKGEWKGERRGVRMQFRRANQGELFGSSLRAYEPGMLDDSATVEWKAYARGTWTSGRAGTVWDACKAIERL